MATRKPIKRVQLNSSVASDYSDYLPKYLRFSQDNPNSHIDALLVEFVEYLEEGNPISVVCDLTGVALNTYRDWVRKGEAYESALQHRTHKAHDEIFYVFLIATRTAEAKWKRSAVQRLNLLGNRLWQRDLALLERRDRQNWGKDLRETRPDEFDPDEVFL